VGRRRDVDAFERRAGRYDRGWLGNWHAQVVAATRDIARSTVSEPASILDVGCATGRLLHTLADAVGPATTLLGVDPSPAMIESARRATSREQRTRFAVAVAESLPVPDGAFELVLTTTSFDHWADQAAGLRECRRALQANGRFVLVDLISPLLWPTTVGPHGKARTPRQVRRLLFDAGLRPTGVHSVSTLIRAVTASVA
jgi:ubiquinone/menaquinone biosynthesis C-methylase UbiE